MVRFLSFIFIAFVFSCTIIEDGDITSQEELDNLKLLSIEINQETVSSNTTSTATVTSTASVNIPVSAPPFSGTVTKLIRMDWPAFSATSKLKLRSGDVTPFKSYTSYLSSGQPYTFYLFHLSGSDTIIFEMYRFRYDANGRLSTIITNAPYIDGGPPTSKDTLIYGNSNNASELTNIIRNPSPSPFALFSTGDSIFQTSWTFDFQGKRYTQNCQKQDCGGSWGGNYNVLGTNGFPSGVMNLTSTQRAYLSIEDFNNIDQSKCNSNPCPGWIDTFYFHPLMMLKDNFEIGDDLLFIYMVDWWQTPATQVSVNNEKVTFTFNYDF